ncbi:MFS transporter [Caballeronia sp. dw_19]|uniref:MFS transporter n=1 Tax=Caballeronia sp. dw_19 TaxID=2719791 RepID=UPI001BD5820D|nr:MFS transporter [Caballeronia sp. dw_19]
MKPMWSPAKTAEISARLDRLPPSRYVWKLVLLLSFGGMFEFYNQFLAAYAVPGMAASGLFTPQSLGIFGVLSHLGISGAGTFVFATFFGLFVGTIVFGSAADRFGRRSVFVWSMVTYSIAAFILAFQATGFGADLLSFFVGVALGVESVTIDTYISELIPAAERGRAIAVNQFVQFCAVPIVALLAWQLVPRRPFGFDGWRWVVLVGSTGAVIVWLIQRRLPESPRWLARRGREAEAELITAKIEAAVAAELGRDLPAPGPVAVEAAATSDDIGAIWRTPYRRRTIMLSVFNFFQTIGFYGFASWVPTLLIAKGIHITTSLEYSFIIAVANPLSPLVGTLIADRMERKWEIVTAASLVGIFGLLFSQQSTAILLIAFGVLVTLSNNWMSFAYHGYQSELFPTQIRSRAVGFVYSWSRLSGALSGLMIGFFLQSFGVTAVFLFIAFSMVMVMISIGVFGPLTRGLTLEQISH